MNATPVSKEEARMLVAELGYNQAADKLQMKAATLRQWAKRFSWNVTRTHAQQTVTSVTKPSEALADTLAEHERETRLSLARYASRAAKDAEGASLRDAPLVHKAAQVAGIVHKWDSEKTNTQFTLNVLNINSLDNRLGEDTPTIDVE
jgi:uncharacterized protein YjcR